MRVSSSLADHVELREPAPAADAVEMELRCVGGAFSALGMLIIERQAGYERCEDEDGADVAIEKVD
jgi:hypothetical protein